MSSRVGQVPSCPCFRSHLSGYMDISAGQWLGSSPSSEQWVLILLFGREFSGLKFGNPCGALLLKAIMQNNASDCVSYQHPKHQVLKLVSSTGSRPGNPGL